MKKTDTEEMFSYFKIGVSCTSPTMDTDLVHVYALIRSYRLKEVTQKIREGRADKTKVLPSVTFSGTFDPRCKGGLVTYSSLVCMDLDKLDSAPSLKEKISKDSFLNPVLLFISPRGKGLKIVVRVSEGVKEEHGSYFDAIRHYLKDSYGIEADSSVSDWSRLCFLCYDPDVYFNPEGSVAAEALLKLLPAPDDATNRTDAINSRDARSCVSTPTGRNAETTDKPSDKLNKLPEIHNLAVSALERAGWRQKSEELWTRPGKEVREGHSAKYNIRDQEGIWCFTCFSDNAHPFKLRGYSDVQIICLLDYNDDWTACITDLALKYLPQ